MVTQHNSGTQYGMNELSTPESSRPSLMSIRGKELIEFIDNNQHLTMTAMGFCVHLLTSVY